MKTNLHPQKLSNLLINFPNLGGISNIKFWRKPFFTLFLFFISVATVFPQSWTQLGTNIEEQESYSLLGYSVSMSADGYTIIAGGPGLDQNEEDSGYAKVLIWNGASWIQKGSDLYGEAYEDQFGYSVSISSDGNTIAVGAIQDDDDQLRLGYAKIFTWNGTSWILKGNKISGENAYDRFGTSISLSSDGNIVAVNSRNGTNGEEAGNVKIFTWNGSVWEQKGSDLDGNEWDGFGWSISLSSDGNTLAVGVANGNVLHGYARLYNWSGTEWVQKGNDLVGDAEWDRFGFSVSISDDGNTVAIGASQNSGNGERSGQLKVFNWNGSNWMQKGSDIYGQANDYLGWSVSLNSDGNTVAVGVTPFNTNRGWSNGNVKVYFWNNSSWEQVGEQMNGDEEGDRAGYKTAINSDGSIVAMAAPFVGYVKIYSYMYTGISGISDTNKITIRPNPFTSLATIQYELKKPEKVIITIYNQLSKQVYHTEVNQLQGNQQLIWKTEELPDGIYYYRLQVGNQVSNGKMVKVR